MKRNLIYYLITIGGFGALIWFMLQSGVVLEEGKVAVVAETATENTSSIWNGLGENLSHSLSVLILQIITIMLVARLFGMIFKKIGQPSVVGEILAGIVLGPSLLGWLLPDVSAFLFPSKASLDNLQFLSQVGLILFMFVIGMELDGRALKNKAHEAIIISHASIIFPFFLGVALSFLIYTQFAPADVKFSAFALFMGIAMSITAFPVLARIVQERGLTRTPLGSMAITCAAADDVTAWCILAVVIAIVKAGAVTSALLTILFASAYVALMFYAVKPLLAKLGKVYSQKEVISKPVVAIVFLVLLTSSYLSEVIGIHALFGAFLAGVIMPEKLNFKQIITEKIEDVALVLLLPLFFVFTGLRTEIGLLNTPGLWLICLGVIGVAVLGKLGGSALSAKFVGQSWKESLSIGVLMNTRGLMELVVLNIGYDLGILSPEIFAMMVLMALCTTFMTGPALDLINWLWRKKAGTAAATEKPRILVSFGFPQMGGTLLRLVNGLLGPQKNAFKVTALHITPRNEISPTEAVVFERESFAPIKSEAARLQISIETLYRSTEEVSNEIIEISKEIKPDLVILGGARMMFQDNILGGKIRKLLHEIESDVFVFSDRGFRHPDRILVMELPGGEPHLNEIASRFKVVAGAKIETWTWVSDNITHAMLQFDKTYLSDYDLLIISAEAWKRVLGEEQQWMKSVPSLLVVQKGNKSNLLCSQPALEASGVSL